MSKVRYFLQSTVIPENRFEILEFNRETRVATLKGQYAAWDEELSDEKMEKYHYIVAKEVVE